MAKVVANSTAAAASSQVEMVDIIASSQSSLQSHVVQIVSNDECSSSELIQDNGIYFEKCVPLLKVALKGDWNAAKHMIEQDDRLLRAAIVKRSGKTLLQVAAGSNHVHFVQELLKKLDPHDLELKDKNKNNAFCSAAASGNMKIADMMIKKNGELPKKRGGVGMTPLYLAALQGKNGMTRHLFPMTSGILDEEDKRFIFFLLLQNGLYDLALQMLEENKGLASAQNDENETGLHILARKPADFTHQGPWNLRNLVMGSSVTPLIKLVRKLWNILVMNHTETKVWELISLPTQITFDATKLGNFKFVAELMRADPDLMWEVDAENRSIIHIAVLHRNSSIFNLIHEIGATKDLIVTFEDHEKNNMLHHAAKLAPSAQLKRISGPALQMTHELLWFQEVEKIMLPSYKDLKNCDGKTPHALFTEEHKDLLTEAASWTKNTAKNCMLVSTLIATGVFAATFNLPGGRNSTTGTPTYLTQPLFLTFAISDAIALISSSASILMFLSILDSSYAEDNYFRSLPFKLLFGLIAQFVSITSMMIAFGVSFFITYYHGSNWVPIFISVLAFLPIPFFTLILFPLSTDIIHSSYFCLTLFRPRKPLLC
ncbi:hypothetical protein HN51_004582 [Arachis hypogaea]|uniref:PGG domain-containing protein n=1 Tax=Arachis hypogaea TaxID=3818 RepID=A0A445DI20_ARAHY|nr:ankyrin repeat-containing protein NPR4 [Arachis hypogaea]QHO38161.1 uncharacterized protein DS421_4g117990 [Arachis hypogaea]RYR62775.1 hypothetical protein Ahy_A04g020523 isoform A [Arachis hypogaea]RYR62776.1 hypothetical protein Ahy_A04g020523 isoform B [Arachis hypogaea]